MTERARPKLIQRTRLALRRRIRRLRPDLVPAEYRWLVFLSWAASLVVTAALLFMDPNAVDVVKATAVNPLDVFFAPVWLRLVLAAAVAVLASSATTLSALGVVLRGRRRWQVILFETTLAVAAGFPVLALAADQMFIATLFASLAFLAIEVFAHVPAARRIPAFVAVLAGFVLVAWVPLLVSQFHPVPISGSYTWAAMFWFAATFAVFGAYYGLVRASESRSDRLNFMRRSDLRAGAAWACIGLVSMLVLIRSTVARDIFNEFDAQLWSPWQKGPMAWAIAIIVGVLIVVPAVRSSSRPFGRYGSQFVPAVIAGAGAIVLVFSWIAVLTSLIVAALSGLLYLPQGWIDWYRAVQLVVIATLALIVCSPRFHRTGARAIAWVSAAYLIPVLVVLAFPLVQPDWYRVATSVQVVVVLLVAAVGLATWNLIRPSRSVAWSVIVRLALIPFIVVSAGLLLPEVFAWSSRFILVIGAIVSLLFLMPSVAADPRRRALDLLGASSAALLVVTVALMALPSVLREETFTLFGTLWLSVPVITALVLDFEARTRSSGFESRGESSVSTAPRLP